MRSILICSLVTLALGASAQTSKPTEPEAFALVKKLVGGVWRAKIGADKTIPLETRYRFTGGGKVVESEGIVGDPKKPVLLIHAKLGIDPVSNTVFYLDTHNDTTIYFGHVTASGDTMIIDFNALSGDTGHYRAELKFGKDDTYTSKSFVIKADGTEVPFDPMVVRRTKN